MTRNSEGVCCSIIIIIIVVVVVELDCKGTRLISAGLLDVVSWFSSVRLLVLYVERPRRCCPRPSDLTFRGYPFRSIVYTMRSKKIVFELYKNRFHSHEF